MLNAPEMDLAPVAAWGIAVPAADGQPIVQSLAWSDAGGGVDLTGFRIEGSLVWDGGSIALSSEAGTILIEDQAELPGWFTVELAVDLARTLPREIPVTYAFRVDRGDGDGFGPSVLRGQVYPSWGASG